VSMVSFFLYIFSELREILFYLFIFLNFDSIILYDVNCHIAKL
jgi:hypothetical protein